MSTFTFYKDFLDYYMAKRWRVKMELGYLLVGSHRSRHKGGWRFGIGW